MATTTPVQSRLDLIEKIVIILFYSLFSYRLLHAYFETRNNILLIFLFDQFLILFFTLIRKNAETISLKISDWLIAVLGTIVPFLMGPIGQNPVLSGEITLPLMLFGICLHLLAKLYLSRSFGVVAAKREIKRYGPYRIIRHPMYAGYMIVQTGLLLSGPTFYNFCITGIVWILYFVRLSAEEKILVKDSKYQEFIKVTRYRLVPGLY